MSHPRFLLRRIMAWLRCPFVHRWHSRRSEYLEDFIKLLYEAGGRVSVGEARKLLHTLSLPSGESATVVGQLVLEGWLVVGTDGLLLTDKGRQVALRLIRAHRIYEQYLAEHSGYDPEEWHERAHRMEHHISDAEQERFVSLLGNPLYDPHGDPIPTERLEVLPLRHAVQKFSAGTYWRIVHIEDDDRTLFAQIAATGLAKDSMFFLKELGEEDFSFCYEGECFVLPLKCLSVIDCNPMTAEEAEKNCPPTAFRLTRLAPHETGTIVALSPSCRGALRRRLLDLGFVRGSRVGVAMRSPLGNPVAYVVRGTAIALRHEQAQHILITRHATTITT